MACQTERVALQHHGEGETLGRMIIMPGRCGAEATIARITGGQRCGELVASLGYHSAAEGDSGEGSGRCATDADGI
jgi:hypothetical protein